MSVKYRISSSSEDEDVKPFPTEYGSKFDDNFNSLANCEIKTKPRAVRTRKKTANRQSVKRKLESDEEEVDEPSDGNEDISDLDYVPEVQKARPKRGPAKKATARKNTKKIKTELKSENLNDDCKDEIQENILIDQKGSNDQKKAGRKKKVASEEGDNKLCHEIKLPKQVQDQNKNESSADYKAGTSGVGKNIKSDIDWEEAEVLAEDLNLDYYIVRNIVKLLDEDNTIPFIARYRKEMTGNMSPEKLREVKEAYETLKNVKTKASSMVKNIEKLGKLNPSLKSEILSAKSMSELDHINAAFKTSKATLADRARELGLETPALTLLCGNSLDPIQPAKFVCFRKTKGLASPEDVELGMQHIIADLISKDRGIRDLVRKLKSSSSIILSCSQSKSASKATSKKETAPDKKGNAKTGHHSATSAEEESKYQNYYNFKINTRFIRPHQVLAINRGEKNKILSVKVDVPQSVYYQLYDHVRNRWLNQGISYPLRYRLVEKSMTDAYERLILPLIVRQVRSELTQIAETASIEVFASNLKNLLLQPPLRGKVVMGIDPGFRNGCKLAVISHTGDVLLTDVIYPNFNSDDIPPYKDNQALRLRDHIYNNRCETIALGNGTACRETEEYLGRLIQSGWFKPLDIVYTIVNEQGASIYSCSPEAQKEFPNLDTNLISAVSIARRLQDPLGELVKIEARHLGVGMYQHDVPDAKLRSTLDEVVVECVSFVGVDLNAASQCILRRIAGLNATKAQNIIDWRTNNGPFRNREQIKEVKGIGAKSFEQCAGFVRILRQTCGIESSSIPKKEEVKETKKGKKLKTKETSDKLNPLDSTWIHPESYHIAERIIQRCNAKLEDIGSYRFIEMVRNTVNYMGLRSLSTEMKASEELTKLIIDGLMQLPDHDLRSEFSKPLFRRGVKSLEDLRTGDVVSGIVRNVTHFGAFVDIGVGRDGLLPTRLLKPGTTLPSLGDKVEVQIADVDVQRRRIAVELVSVC